MLEENFDFIIEDVKAVLYFAKTRYIHRER